MTLPVIEFHNGIFSVRKAGRDDIAEIVYMLIQLVPPGCITTYSSIARAVGVSPRYVARILKENRNHIVIPCHRVVKSNGEIGGYTINGRRADCFKEKLLMLESLRKSLCKLEVSQLMYRNMHFK